ncbi:UNVERIFIED_CONTAM: hypothetical protein RMT77_011306 [Armadillidium vulgare]
MGSEFTLEKLNVNVGIDTNSKPLGVTKNASSFCTIDLMGRRNEKLESINLKVSPEVLNKSVKSLSKLSNQLNQISNIKSE